jgi:hypothetical protein
MLNWVLQVPTIHDPQFAVLTDLDERCLLKWLLVVSVQMATFATEVESPG